MTDIVVRPEEPAIGLGVRAGASLAPAVVPLGIALGVTLAETSAPPVVAWATAPLLVAGASQLVLMSHLDAGATALAAAFAAVLVNARFVVYGAALAHRFEAQPAWFRWLGPWFVVDQTYAIVTAGAPSSRRGFRGFYLGAAVLLWVLWSGSVAVGVVLGPVLPPWLPVDFVLPAMFVALLVPGLRGQGELLAAVCGAVSAIALAPTSALIGAAFAGAAIGSRRSIGEPS